jgi:hypothetical protein
MKWLIFLLISCELSKSLIALDSPRCAALRQTIAQAEDSDLLMDLGEIEPHILRDCLKAKTLVKNAGPGHDRRHYEGFIETLFEAEITPELSHIILEQVSVALSSSDFSLREAQGLVNTIAVYSFVMGDKRMHMIETGWGDDDYFHYSLFLQLGTEILATGSDG